ncbi:hypothetical protein D3C81_1087480 [compost metagenome]
MVGRQIVTESPHIVAILILPCIIIWNDVIEELGLCHMSIYNVQNYTHPSFMHRIDQAL